MPANYAHYRFGKLALPTLPPEAKACVQRFRRMYDMGLHGPDIFFYHNPFWKTAQGDLGNHFHDMSGKDFFPAACAAAKTEASLAYLLGLLGHYCLDSHCHSYINSLVDIDEVEHVAFESEFERHLLLLDKEPSPETFDMSKRLKLTRGECMTVSEFYPGSTGAGVSRSVRFMAFAAHFLSSPDRPRREKLLKSIKPSLCAHMVPAQSSDGLVLYISDLTDRYNQALTDYPAMVRQLLDHRKTGEDFGPLFTPTFG